MAITHLVVILSLLLANSCNSQTYHCPYKRITGPLAGEWILGNFNSTIHRERVCILYILRRRTFKWASNDCERRGGNGTLLDLVNLAQLPNWPMQTYLPRSRTYRLNGMATNTIGNGWINSEKFPIPGTDFTNIGLPSPIVNNARFQSLSYRSGVSPTRVNRWIRRGKRIPYICQAPAVLMEPKMRWNYRELGPDEWFKTWPICKSGQRQSPINIDSSLTIANITKFTSVNDAYPMFEMLNDGNIIKLYPKTDPTNTITGGYFGSETYKLSQIHFHWGKTDERGSEHLLDNERFPIEVHVIHHNVKYANLSEAETKDDGLAVVGFLIPLSSSATPNPTSPFNMTADSVINKIPEIIQANVSKRVDVSFGGQAYFTLDLKSFYHYEGSLTTPTCSENVKWSVNQVIPGFAITQNELEVFRTLKTTDNKPMVDNFRYPQPLLYREIKMTPG